MFVRVAVYDVPDPRADDVVKSFGEAIEEIGELEGLLEAYLLVGNEADHVMTMTVWSSSEAMVASRVRASRLRSEAARAIGGEVRSSTEYRVAAHRDNRADESLA